MATTVLLLGSREIPLENQAPSLDFVSNSQSAVLTTVVQRPPSIYQVLVITTQTSHHHVLPPLRPSATLISGEDRSGGDRDGDDWGNDDQVHRTVRARSRQQIR